MIELLLSHPKCIVDPYDITIWDRLMRTYSEDPSWWVDCPSYLKSLFIHRRVSLSYVLFLSSRSLRRSLNMIVGVVVDDRPY